MTEARVLARRVFGCVAACAIEAVPADASHALVAAVADALGRGAPCTLAEIAALAERWVVHCDRGARPATTKMRHGEESLNDAQAAGLGLARLLWTGAFPELDVDLQAVTGGANSSVAFAPSPLKSMPFSALQASVAALQLNFAKQYVMDARGMLTNTDMTTVLFAVLARLGFFLAHDFDPPPGLDDAAPASNPDTVDAWSAPSADGGVCKEAEAVRPCPQPASLEVEPDALPVAAADGGPRPRLPARRRREPVLDAVHAMLSLHALLGRAEAAPPWDPATAGELTQLHTHHREAGMDAYNELVLYNDCPVGTITQYMHKFNHLFHSVSQVVYFNYPAYRRPPQKSYDALAQPGAPAVNLLPALQEIAPLPVLFENTGAGHAAAHARHPRAWVVWAGFVLLVHSDMRVRCAPDLRALV